MAGSEKIESRKSIPEFYIFQCKYNAHSDNFKSINL